MSLGNISKDVADDNINQTGLNGNVCEFSINYGSIDIDNTLGIHKHLMKKNIKNVWTY